MPKMPDKRPENCAILLAGGSGKRMANACEDKILAPLNGVPAIVSSVRAFLESACTGTLVFVCRDATQENAIRACLEKNVPASHTDTRILFCRGGEERRDSVLNGLRCARENGENPAGTLAFIHDCARPLIAPEQIRELARIATRKGAAVLAHKSVNTIKRVPAGTRAGEACVPEDLDRSRLWEMETPQVFPLEKILAAYEKAVAGNHAITDDVSAFSLLPDGKIALVENSKPNPKLTVPADLRLLQLITENE